jgi:flavin-dependent dehydrogenase
MTRLSTISLDDAARRSWDAIVIGAGPAGTIAAIELARADRKTLLVDGKRFPRDKVCGGCLNGRAIAALKQAGLEPGLDKLGAPTLDSVRFVTHGRSATFPTPAGFAVSRYELDALLVEAAIDHGVSFLPETSATVEPATTDDQRHVQLVRRSLRVHASARVVICADGLLRSSLKHLPSFHAQVAQGSRIGVGALLDDSTTHSHASAELASVYGAGQIVMAVARNGYVGLTRVERNRLNVAAALDPAALHERRSISDCVSALLDAAGLPIPSGMMEAAWQGTPPLTSSAGRVAGERLFVVGDAAGYVEPFTGEGIARAIDGGLAVAPLAAQACDDWHADFARRWERFHRSTPRRRQLTCRAMAWILRRPWSTEAAMTVCRTFPWAARHVISRIQQPPPSRGTLAVHAP